MQYKIEAREVQRPPCLSPIELLGCAEVLQVLMVRPYFHLMSSAFKEMSPFFETANNREHLLVMDLIVSLDRTEAL
jgi:hypothetical protein